MWISSTVSRGTRPRNEGITHQFAGRDGLRHQVSCTRPASLLCNLSFAAYRITCPERRSHLSHCRIRQPAENQHLLRRFSSYSLCLV